MQRTPGREFQNVNDILAAKNKREAEDAADDKILTEGDDLEAAGAVLRKRYVQMNSEFEQRQHGYDRAIDEDEFRKLQARAAEKGKG
ncbi:hypothetical protein [Mycolicibacterium boenickei]|uniref:Uncharacterized protein n=1 Tax=Mycolicibacterium boenickei TaxID=146017 RepID=A0ABN5ZLY6_9MYCO|nr:hypothetical protein [Mycolicibacterium boenickei]PEG62659.1 hypothetical protein CQY21_02415 [Mycolicibacterium boenickei]BBX94136.1 hypothetical protein MBOE_57850 [Mycolicibacterium boenickei]